MNIERKNLMAKAQIEFYQLRNDDPDFANQYSGSDKDFQECLEDVYLPTIEKPIVKLNNSDKNAFRIIGAISKILRDAGLDEREKEFIRETKKEETKLRDYDYLLQIAIKYVDIE